MADLYKQITELENQNRKLKNYQKTAEKIKKLLTDLEPEKEQKAVEKIIETPTEFERQICDYYSLYDDDDRQKFLEIMLNSKSKNFFRSRRYGGVSQTEGE